MSTFQLGVSLDQTVRERDIDDLLWVFGSESSAVSIHHDKVTNKTIYNVHVQEMKS